VDIDITAFPLCIATGNPNEREALVCAKSRHIRYVF
jgi:hypothetical protein